MPAGRPARGAAAAVALCAAIIFGFTLLMLGATVWNQRPADEPAFYSTLPGVDLAALSAEQRSALLKRLNAQRCPCGCMRTVAGCRNRHAICELSLAEARAQAAAIASGRRRAAPAAPSSK
jgi:hypothetical protein